MKKTVFISLLILSFCVPFVTMAVNISERTDSLYGVAVKERTFSAYIKVLEHMRSEEESGNIYKSCVAEATKLAQRSRKPGYRAVVLKYRAFDRLSDGDNEGFLTDLTESRRIFRNCHDRVGECDVIDDIASYYLYRDQVKAVGLLEEGLKLLKDTVTVDKASMLNTLSIIRYYRGDIDAGIKGFKEVLKMLDLCGETSPLPSMSQNIATLYSDKEMYDSAAYYYEKALDYCQKTGNHLPETNIYSNLATLYTKIDRYETARKYADKAVEAALRKHDKLTGMVQAYHVRAGVRKAMKDFTGAKADFKKALEIAVKTESPQLMLKPLPGLMSIYRSEKNDSVEFLSELGSKYAAMIDSPSPEVSNFYEVRAEYLASKGDRTGSLMDLLWVRQHGMSAMPSKELLGRIGRDYMALGQYEKASLYLDSAYVASDSLFSRNMQEAVARWDAKFENQEKQLQVERMEAQRYRLVFWLVAAAMLLILLGVLIVVQRRSLKRKAELKAADKYVEGLESERNRISHELHDGVCNDLLGVQLLGQTAHTPDDVHEMLEYLGRARDDVRRISHDLASPSLERTSMREMTEQYLDRMRKGSRIQITFDCELSNEPDSTVSANTYRIIQELTANAVKHSDGTAVHISVNDRSGHIHLCVQTNGTMKMSSRPGIGMLSVQNRVKLLGGKITTGADDSGNYTKIDL